MRTVIGQPGGAPARLSADGTASPAPGYEIALLKPDEWETLKSLRKKALEDSPGKLLLLLSEAKYEEDQWRGELFRNEWFVCRTSDGAAVAIFRIDDVPDVARRHLGCMWVSPDHRNRGLGRKMVVAALQHLAQDTTQDYLYLYVFTGNKNARRLYESLDFLPVGPPELLDDGSGRSEQLMRIDLADTRADMSRRAGRR
jgi:ribosomal protein S18 acetylase RimI-like enzyme